MAEQRKSTKNNGKPYEKLVREIFDYLNNQGVVKTINVQHNIRLPGKVFKHHQIDVYWEFEQANVRHSCVVEVKDHGRKVTQDIVEKFNAVLDDLPGRPRGIFVSRAGYSPEVERVASDLGITLFVLSEPERHRVKIRDDCVVTASASAMESLTMSNGEIYSRIRFDMIAHNPHLSSLVVSPTKTWARGYYEKTGQSQKIDVPLFLGIKSYAEVQFLSPDGEVLSTLKRFIQDDIHTLLGEKIDSRGFEHVFDVGSLVKSSSPEWPLVEVAKIAYTLTITHDTVDSSYMRTSGFREYVLKNLADGKEIRFDAKVEEST